MIIHDKNFEEDMSKIYMISLKDLQIYFLYFQKD